MRLRFALVVCALALFLPANAQACSCGPIGPACQEAWNESTGAVFVGEVTKIRTWKALWGGDFEIHFSVVESFKGVKKRSVTVRTGTWSGSCGYSFEANRRYLVYAHEEKGTLSTSICTRTQPLEHAQEDVAYFRSLASLPETGRIYGTVRRYTHDKNFVPKYVPNIMDHYLPPEEDMVAVAAMPGVKVTVRSPRPSAQEWKTSVDANGNFEFAGLDADSYLVSVELPPNLTQPGLRVAHVASRGCAAIHFRAQSDGWIRGYVVDAREQTLPGILVSIIEADMPPDAVQPFKSAHTKADGGFAIGPLPPRRYLLGINITKTDKLADSNKGIPTIYYPGQTDALQATAISLGDGEKKEGLTIHLPIPWTPR